MSSEIGYRIRRLAPDEAEGLARFYEALSESSLRLFAPLGRHPKREQYQEVAQGNAPDVDDRLDLMAVDTQGRLIGWAFVVRLQGDRPGFGVAVADALHGRGIGRALLTRLFADVRAYGVRQVYLNVVRDNAKARRLYESFGFRAHEECVNENDGLTYVHMVKDLNRRLK